MYNALILSKYTMGGGGGGGGRGERDNIYPLFHAKSTTNCFRTGDNDARIIQIYHVI